MLSACRGRSDAAWIRIVFAAPVSLTCQQRRQLTGAGAMLSGYRGAERFALARLDNIARQAEPNLRRMCQHGWRYRRWTDRSPWSSWFSSLDSVLDVCLESELVEQQSYPPASHGCFYAR